jgi:hypothetical protein
MAPGVVALRAVHLHRACRWMRRATSPDSLSLLWTPRQGGIDLCPRLLPHTEFKATLNTHTQTIISLCGATPHSLLFIKSLCVFFLRQWFFLLFGSVPETARPNSRQHPCRLLRAKCMAFANLEMFPGLALNFV